MDNEMLDKLLKLSEENGELKKENEMLKRELSKYINNSLPIKEIIEMYR